MLLFWTLTALAADPQTAATLGLYPGPTALVREPARLDRDLSSTGHTLGGSTRGLLGAHAWSGPGGAGAAWWGLGFDADHDAGIGREDSSEVWLAEGALQGGIGQSWRVGGWALGAGLSTDTTVSAGRYTATEYRDTTIRPGDTVSRRDHRAVAADLSATLGVARSTGRARPSAHLDLSWIRAAERQTIEEGVVATVTPGIDLEERVLTEGLAEEPVVIDPNRRGWLPGGAVGLDLGGRPDAPDWRLGAWMRGGRTRPALDERVVTFRGRSTTTRLQRQEGSLVEGGALFFRGFDHARVGLEVEASRSVSVNLVDTGGVAGVDDRRTLDVRVAVPVALWVPVSERVTLRGGTSAGLGYASDLRDRRTLPEEQTQQREGAAAFAGALGLHWQPSAAVGLDLVAEFPPVETELRSYVSSGSVPTPVPSPQRWWVDSAGLWFTLGRGERPDAQW